MGAIGVVPGGVAMPTAGKTFYLQNFGTANLAIKVGISSTPSNTSNIDLTKVHLIFSRTDTGGSDVSLTLRGDKR